MNKTIAAIVILMISGLSYSQPKLIVHTYGGYSIPLPNLKGNVQLGANYNDYGMKNGYNFGIDGKYAVEKSARVRITASVIYNLFRNNDVFTEINGNQTRKMDILTAGIGAEYSFLPKNTVNPFLGIEFTGNFFNGKVIDQIGDTVHNEYNQKHETRLGLQLNAGVDVISSKQIGVVAGVRYNIANLFGKDSASVSPGEYALWDKEIKIDGNSISSKNIQYMQLYVGVSFYFLQPKKKLQK